MVVGVAVIGEGGASAWTVVETEMDEDVELISASAAAAAGGAVVKATTRPRVMRQRDSDSEEETVVVLGTSEPSMQHIDLAKAVKRRQK